MKRILLPLLLLAATPALAHHPMIGLDHLAFVVLVGLTAALAGGRLGAVLAFVGATLVGASLHLGGVQLPLAELVIAG